MVVNWNGGAAIGFWNKQNSAAFYWQKSTVSLTWVSTKYSTLSSKLQSFPSKIPIDLNGISKIEVTLGMVPCMILI